LSSRAARGPWRGGGARTIVRMSVPSRQAAQRGGRVTHGAGGGRFGINSDTTVGGGLFWEYVDVSAGLSLVEYSLPICGARLCGHVRGVAPGASLRADFFGPYLSGALGISVDCAGAWITGSAPPAR